MSSNSDKRSEFMSRIKVDQSSLKQNNAAKKNQFSSNNANDSSNSAKGDAPDRQRSLDKGRGNER